MVCSLQHTHSFALSLLQNSEQRLTIIEVMMHHKLPHVAKEAAPTGRRAVLTWNAVAQAQALYYLVTGLWPLLHIRSFLKVTGPKTDLWLVKTVGVLIGVIGVVLGVAGRQQSARPEIALLALGSAAGLTGIDVVYVARRRISPIYLLDAVAELVLIFGWVITWRQRSWVHDVSSGNQ
jgi:hypothetical protein